MNKRQLKKSIHTISGILFAECIATSLYSGERSREEALTLMHSLVLTHNDFIARISHPEPGMKAREYYQHLIKDFNNNIQQIQEILG